MSRKSRTTFKLFVANVALENLESIVSRNGRLVNSKFNLRRTDLWCDAVDAPGMNLKQNFGIIFEDENRQMGLIERRGFLEKRVCR